MLTQTYSQITEMFGLTVDIPVEDSFIAYFCPETIMKLWFFASMWALVRFYTYRPQTLKQEHTCLPVLQQ